MPQPPAEFPVNTPDINSAVLLFRTLNNKTNLQIIRLIDKHSRLTVSDIYVQLRMAQSHASLQLSHIKKANLVQTKRQGHFIYYSVNYDRMAFLHHAAAELLKK
jgi:DNA-binding transcriptional ArsR family regulator